MLMSLDKRRDLIISTKIKVKLQTKTNTTSTFWNVTSIIMKKRNFSPFCFFFCFSSSLYHSSFKSYKTSDQRLTKLLYYLWAWRYNNIYMRSDSIFGLCHIQFLEKTKDFFEDKRAHNLECFSLLSSFFYNMNMKSSKEARQATSEKIICN